MLKNKIVYRLMLCAVLIICICFCLRYFFESHDVDDSSTFVSKPKVEFLNKSPQIDSLKADAKTVAKPDKSDQVAVMLVLEKLKKELIESEKKRIELFYSTTTDFSSELCLKINKLSSESIAEWDAKIKELEVYEDDPDIAKRIKELNDFVHWGKDEDIGEFKTRIVNISLKTGPNGEDLPRVNVSEADSATGGTKDGNNWTRFEGAMRMTTLTPEDAQSRYGHLYKFEDEQ